MTADEPVTIEHSKGMSNDERVIEYLLLNFHFSCNDILIPDFCILNLLQSVKRKNSYVSIKANDFHIFNSGNLIINAIVDYC